MFGYQPYKANIRNRINIKNRWTNKDEIIFITGRTLTRNTIFLTKKLFSVIEFVAFAQLSEINNQGTIPDNSQRTNGMLSTGTVLKPTWKTVQYTRIEISGWTNAQRTPIKEPRYFDFISFLDNSSINL